MTRVKLKTTTLWPDLSAFSTAELIDEIKCRNQATIVGLIQADGSVAMAGSGGLPARAWLSEVLERTLNMETEFVVFGAVEGDEDEGCEIDADED